MIQLVTVYCPCSVPHDSEFCFKFDGHQVTEIILLIIPQTENSQMPPLRWGGTWGKVPFFPILFVSVDSFITCKNTGQIVIGTYFHRMRESLR